MHAMKKKGMKIWQDNICGSASQQQPLFTEFLQNFYRVVTTRKRHSCYAPPQWYSRGQNAELLAADMDM